MSIMALIGPVMSVIDRVLKDKAEAEQVKMKLMEEALKKDGEIAKAAASVVQAEAQGDSWMQRNWRPSLMFLFGFIIFNNYILIPYASTFGFSVPHVDIPPDMWTMIQIGLGGYIVGRSGEKIARVVAPAIKERAEATHRRTVDDVLDNRP